MYYPFLRARQFELIAMRELVLEDALQERVIPIFEPVKKTFNNFDIAFKIFSEKKQLAYIIINAEVGDLNYPDGHQLIADYVSGKAILGDIYRPAFHYNDKPGLSKEILETIEKEGYENCLLICKSNINHDIKSFIDLIDDPRITTIGIEDPGRSRGLTSKLKSTNKPIIRLDDLFESQQRNSDYLDIEEHRFSEEHIYFADDNFVGFSDYTTISSVFTEGGSTPRAVVIHLTFQKTNKEIWIKHFTSDTNDSIANVQGKFKEAAEKAISFCREYELSNSAIDELASYYDTEHYPGLGTVKKISIKNHVILVSEYLKNNS